MAKIIGRTVCPDCGFEGAHIKASDGKQPYRHCPDCGLMTQARNGAQAKLLLAKARPVGPVDSGPNSSPTPPAADRPIIVPASPAPVPAAPAPAKPKRPGLWDQLMRGDQ